MSATVRGAVSIRPTLPTAWLVARVATADQLSEAGAGEHHHGDDSTVDRASHPTNTLGDLTPTLPWQPARCPHQGAISAISDGIQVRVVVDCSRSVAVRCSVGCVGVPGHFA